MKIKEIGFGILLLLLCTINAHSQIDYEAFSGARKDKYDTLAIDNAMRLAREAKGLQEREINPEKYIVGPGDVFKISILLSKTIDYKATISPEGLLLLDEAGAVDIKNKTLAEAKNIIYNQIAKYFNTKEIYIGMDELRQFKVTVSGAIKKPITVEASAVDRVSEVIDRAGGMRFNASYRNISLIRQKVIGDTIFSVDLIKYFMLGDQESNPFLLGGDIIVVPPSDEDNAIKILGDVNLPGEFEYKEGDSLSTLLGFARGFTQASYLDSVEFARFSQNGVLLSRSYLNLEHIKDLKNFSKGFEGNFQLQSGDRFYVRRMPNWNDMNYTIITGEVNFPGKYPIDESKDRIADLIKRAGGLTEQGSYSNIEFIRQQEAKKKDLELERLNAIPPSERSLSEQRYFTARITERKGVMSVDILNAIKNPSSDDNILLRNKDSIIVPQKVDYINIQGRVINPGNVPYKKGLTYLDYVNIAGGFAYRADLRETFIRKTSGEFFKADAKNYVLEPGDVILVPSKKEIDWIEKVTIWTTILSQLAAILGVIIAISNSSK